jgi:thiosulfate/3-mercaptopyruvate sulfurtransferase
VTDSGNVSSPIAPVLIEPAELAALLDSTEPPALADVRWTLGGPPGRGEFESGHLPGAHWVDLETELSGPPGAGGRHPLPGAAVFTAAMRRIGVRARRPVVAYDGATSLAAARLWWLLTDAGHASVRVLNGGFAAWVAEGGGVERGPDRPGEAGDFVARPGARPRVTGEELRSLLERPDPPPVVDVRAAERYSGAIEPHDPVAGHIPGARNLPSMTSLDERGRFLPAEELSRRFAAVAASPVLYCGSGITAAHSLLAMTAAGREDGHIYPGSWSEWIQDPTRPVATGPQP